VILLGGTQAGGDDRVHRSQWDRKNTRLEIVRDVPGIDTPAMAHGGKAAARKQTRTQDEHRQIPGMPGSVSAGGSE
jgi:hypothetical protein